MRILITGAGGFVGGWLAERLAAAYPAATLYGTVHGPGETRAGAIAISGDLSDPEVAAHAVAISQPTHVFHLAGFASAAGLDEVAIARANVGATTALLDALKAAGAPCRVLLASSGYAYGPTPDHPAKESAPLDPRGHYATSKVEMEKAVRPYASEALALTVVRAFNHTGPRQRTGFAVPDWASQLVAIEQGKAEPLLRHGNLGSVRDFLDVRDVVEAYRQLLCEIPGSPWRVVNVCSGRGVTMHSVLAGLIAATRVSVRTEVDQARWRDDAWANVGDNGTLLELTGFQPAYALAQTLSATLDWWREQKP
ncbi:MAG: NAD-dependent epimerase/dehydratase family protein [Armatimonas sp.]